MKKLISKKGFSVVELVIVLAVIALILSITVPNFRSMQQEGSLTKAEGDLDTIKIAVTSYWRNNSKAYPANIHTALTSTNPAVITKVLTDPWVSDAATGTYAYTTGSDSAFGDYFIVYTKGPKGDTAPTWDATAQSVLYTGTGRVVSNAPVVKN